MPITFADIFKYHNKNELFLKKYKAASKIAINYNKCDISYSYIMLKLFNKIDEASFKMLLNNKNFDFLSDPQFEWNDRISCNHVPMFFCNAYYQNKFNLTIGDYDDTIITDYLHMCIVMKKKINLKYSYLRLCNEHDALAVEFRNKFVKTIKIPKTSKFNILKERLPSSYERITTKKRLIQEGVYQRNCVASYDDKINANRCAVYSYFYKGQRVTFEVAYRNQKYFIIQAMFKGNKPIDVNEILRIDALINQQETAVNSIKGG